MPRTARSRRGVGAGGAAAGVVGVSGASAPQRSSRPKRRDGWSTPDAATAGIGDTEAIAESDSGSSAAGGGFWTVSDASYRLGIYVTLSSPAQAPVEEQLRRGSFDDAGAARRRRRGSTPMPGVASIGDLGISDGMACHVLSRSVTFCHVLSRSVTFCHVLSRSVTFCHVLSSTVNFDVLLKRAG
jgi:hypothetical protein